MANMAGLPEDKRDFDALTHYVAGPLYCEVNVNAQCPA